MDEPHQRSRAERAGGPPVDPLTDEELDTLANAVVMRQVYIPTDNRTFEYSFGALIAMCKPEQIPSNAGLMWEYYDKAGPRAINGYPMFLSGNWLPIESIQPLIDKVRAKLTALGVKDANGSVDSGS